MGCWVCGHQQMRLGIASPPKPKNEIRLPASHLAAGSSPRAERGPIKCTSLERRLDGRVVTFRDPRAFEVAD
jgi:hypothetical protein